ncbi:MAG: hypothetical protein H0T89_30820 [Deltaproteobacteria bacterium]|nr:hypothetical protein [Deltaproteobacteria bacterium]
MKKWLACFLALTASGCPDIQTDADETGGPLVEFDPGNKIIPFPNNLLLDRTTGKVNLPASCNETATAKALREGVLNKLDGFGTYQTAMSVTLTAPIDMASAADKVLLYKRSADGVAVDPSAANPIPVVVLPGTSIRYDADCMNPGPVASVTIVPLAPLDQRSTYVVALKAGIKSTDGEDYRASSTWALVRQAESPVTFDDNGNLVSERTPLDPSTDAGLASLRGLDLLWKAHATALAFLSAKEHVRGEILLAWEFTTQTVQDALDQTVAGTPASQVSTTPPLRGPTGAGNPVSITAAAAARTNYPFLVCTTGSTTPGTALPESNNTQCFLKLALGQGLTCSTQAGCEAAFFAGTQTCGAVGCQAVGDVLAGALISKQYQVETPNPLGSTCDANGVGTGTLPCKPVPGPWADPVKPPMVKVEGIGALVFVPAAACPAAGCATVVFGHGLGSSKTSAFAIAPQLAANGFQTVAIDFVAHDSRAIRLSRDAAKGCDTGLPVTVAPQCFAPFLSTNLAATRDNIRQSVLDLQSLASSLKTCGTTMCGTLVVDPAKMVYLGISLGGIMGTVATATTPELKAATLNVPGAGWVDIIENTQTLAIKCSVIDGLIDAGILMGPKYDTKGTPADPTDDTGLCVGDEWKTQPGYRQFSAIARWVLDPADPANFMRRLAGTKRFLIQEVVGDTVVPNLATDRQALLGGLTMPLMADPALSGTPPPSAAITSMPMTNKFVKYPDLPANAGTGFPGNAFTHSSLLRPATGTAGLLGTIRIQTDAITYLVLNR